MLQCVCESYQKVDAFPPFSSCGLHGSFQWNFARNERKGLTLLYCTSNSWVFFVPISYVAFSNGVVWFDGFEQYLLSCKAHVAFVVFGFGCMF